MKEHIETLKGLKPNYMAGLAAWEALQAAIDLMERYERGELVEVVRCRDCANGIGGDGVYKQIICMREGTRLHHPDDHCKYSTRRDEPPKGESK